MQFRTCLLKVCLKKSGVTIICKHYKFVLMVQRQLFKVSYSNPLTIAGSFNDWVEDSGSHETNAKGGILLETFSCLDVVLPTTGGINQVDLDPHKRGYLEN